MQSLYTRYKLYVVIYCIIDLGMYMYMQNCEELLKYHPLFEALRILGLHRISNWYACTPVKDGDKAVVAVPHLIGVQVYKGPNCVDNAIRCDYCIQCWHTVWSLSPPQLVSCRYTRNQYIKRQRTGGGNTNQTACQHWMKLQLL